MRLKFCVHPRQSYRTLEVNPRAGALKSRFSPPNRSPSLRFPRQPQATRHTPIVFCSPGSHPRVSSICAPLVSVTMANNSRTIKPEPAAPGSEVWDEERLEHALNQLKLLHIQLRGLRTTIPRMMEPLSSKQPNPQAKFNSFVASVAAAKKEVEDFQHLRNSEEMTKIMDHATQRRKEEPNGIKSWRATDHPDWTTVESS